MDELQILVATMNQKDFSKIEEMRIKSSVIFANQSDEIRYEKLKIKNYQAQMITTKTKGVGINRNIALIAADKEIVIIADDDMQYVDEYENIIMNAFKQLPNADAIIFNIETIGTQMARRKNGRVSRVRFYNALNYGAVRIAFKRKRIIGKNIFFNTNFGGGAPFSAGEDTLFICEMLKKKIKIYTFPETIAQVDQSNSTWFQGYSKKYFYDKGVLFSAVSERFASLLILQDVIRHWNYYKKSRLSIKECLSLMIEGKKNFHNLKPYLEK